LDRSYGDVSSAVNIQRELQGFNLENPDRQLKVRIGLNLGEVIEEEEDYFGSAVNMAARLQGQSTGGDVVLSRTVADDPAVQPLLAGLPAREESVALKGFAQPIGFVRVVPAG